MSPSLRLQIEQEIRERGPVPFSRYMEICLYDPIAGYYSRTADQFGNAGDFYTSSDVHAVFGRLLARQFHQMWLSLASPGEVELLELGAGRGLFARDVLDWTQKKFPDFFDALHYTLQESSPALRARIAENLREHIETGKAALGPPGNHAIEPSDHRVIGRLQLTRSPDEPLTRSPLIVFANEFFDALPVEILSTRGKLHLSLENDRLREIWLPPNSEELEFLDRYGVHPEKGERIEVPLVAQRWMNAVAASIPVGFLIVIDYGYTRAEQLAGHHRGTLMAYRKHSATPDPYQAPGEQDLTTHINFTAIAAAASEAGLQVLPLGTQSQFLMRIGESNQFADAFEDCRLPAERAKVALQLKHLVAPAGMGESFQVMVASRGVEHNS